MTIDFNSFLSGYHNSFGQTSLAVYNNINTMLQSLIQFQNLFNQKVLLNQWAYLAATVYHESAATFGPYKEIRQIKVDTPQRRKVRAEQDKYWFTGYFGRGPTQVTWEVEYKKAQVLTGRPLLSDPDLLLRDLPLGYEIACKSLTMGYMTGKRLDDYINERNVDYVNARRVVNGTDDAKLIASYAVKFYNIFKESVL